MARRRETDSVMDEPSGTVDPSISFTTPGSESTAAGAPAPTTEQIAQRAYEIYQARGGTDGQDIEDWLEAERQLRRPDRGTE
jgi:hypothetical protein